MFSPSPPKSITTKLFGRHRIELSEGSTRKTLIELVFNGQVCSEATLHSHSQQEDVAKFAGYIDPPAKPGEYRPNPISRRLTLQGHVEPATVVPGGKARLKITAIPDPGGMSTLRT